MSDYALIDSGEKRKLERFGSYTLIRPAPMALWSCKETQEVWDSATASFSRENKQGWNNLPKEWQITLNEVKLLLKPTPFGHLGVFAEHAPFWPFIKEHLAPRGKKAKVLNLFAYSGGATVAAAQTGAAVCHLDASKGMVSWARENSLLNNLEKAPIRWIVDDAKKFLVREVKRQATYDAILLDPPTFGRGSSGQVFKIERDLPLLLKLCHQLLSDSPLFLLLTCHTPGFTPVVLKQLVQEHFGNAGVLTADEMHLKSAHTTLPCGAFVKWTP